MTNAITVKWKESEPDVRLSSVEELDIWLDVFEKKCSTDFPVIITVLVHGYEVGIGLGFQVSFVHIEHKSGEPPYLITANDILSDEVIAFYLHGNHHTEISKHNLVPTAVAKEIVREFCISGKPSPRVVWEEV